MIMPIDSKTYKVTVRILPAGLEVDIKLPVSTKSKLIKDSLLDHPNLNIPKFDPEGRPVTYQLMARNPWIPLSDHKTLQECGVKNGDYLFFSQVIKAK
jgi:uncharacterized ubiquitin-like protein YukD